MDYLRLNLDAGCISREGIQKLRTKLSQKKIALRKKAYRTIMSIDLSQFSTNQI